MKMDYYVLRSSIVLRTMVFSSHSTVLSVLSTPHHSAVHPVCGLRFLIILLRMRKGRASDATDAVFAFRQKSLFIAGRTSIGCQKKKIKTLFCTRVCVIQHRNWPLRSTILNAHVTNASPDGLCTRTHTNEAFSSWFCCKSF